MAIARTGPFDIADFRFHPALKHLIVQKALVAVIEQQRAIVARRRFAAQSVIAAHSPLQARKRLRSLIVEIDDAIVAVDYIGTGFDLSERCPHGRTTFIQGTGAGLCRLLVFAFT